MAISKNVMPVEAKFSLSSFLRSLADFSGKHSSRLRAAMRRRSPATRYMHAPNKRPMVNNARYGNWVISHSRASPSHSSQKRGEKIQLENAGDPLQIPVK